LALAFTLAGADCIDVAADPAVVAIAKAAIRLASEFSDAALQRGYRYHGSPLLMVSFNDGEDPHFRKAEFDSAHCPPDCPRPCEAICPTQAIAFRPLPLSSNYSHDLTKPSWGGVIHDRCYGCGRCLPICPVQNITTHSHISTPTEIITLVLRTGVDAIEIHTQVGRLEEFRQLWQAIAPWISHLKVLAISCPDDANLIEYLWALHEMISPLPCELIWQTDGRPMSGDIGAGTTHAAINLGQKVLAAGLPGYVQLAGGTNHYTVPKLQSLGLLHANAASNRGAIEPTPLTASTHIAGVAYGSYARSLLRPVINTLETIEMSALSQERDLVLLSTSVLPTSLRQPTRLEAIPSLLWQAVDLASSLVSQLKSSVSQSSEPDLPT
jgi:Fe-S-cluster-containing hydrogenase component 2